MQFGFLSYASFIICIASGISLAFAFDASKPFESVSLIILQNKPALFVRSLHYWSAQLFLVTVLFHVIDHFLKKTERETDTYKWLRVVLVVPVVLYAMFSGFVLKADYEAGQALRVVSSLIGSLPLIGSAISALFFGGGSGYQIIYMNHIVTATLIIWLVTIDHAKYIMPPANSIIKILPLTVFLSAFFIPSISQNNILSPKGPWYFAGLQELLHWISYGGIVIYAGIILLALMFFIRFLSEKNSGKMKLGFIYLLLIYTLLTVVALFFRGADWKLAPPWKEDTNASNFMSVRNLQSPDTTVVINNLPKIQGRLESCYFCHSGMKGLSKSHDVSFMGCYSCHLGNPLSLSKDIAHGGMTKTPSNLDIVEKTCAASGCHSEIAGRLHNSLMRNMSGVAAVDKYTFNEAKDPDGYYDIDKIDFSDADKHLRGLCASCHLSNNKPLPAPVDELSRGGGCSACHLNYDQNSLTELNLLKNKKKINPGFHPEISIDVKDKSCFGCHSRSGRISTNYEGWQETHYTETDYVSLDKAKYRLLQDGRVFEKQTEDVHHSGGMQCIDCHNSYEVMGDGNIYNHKEKAVKIRCEDCHTTTPRTITYDKMDNESRKILFLRNSTDKSRRYLATAKGNIPFLNIYSSDDLKSSDESPVSSVKYLNLKSNGKQLTINPPSPQCGKDINGHSRLDCKSCHTNWAPQCVGCHTQYKPDIRGWDNLNNKETKYAWTEKDRDFYADYPALGIMTDNQKEKVTTFVPGMVLTINNGKKQIFKRLYAPAFSHTISKNATGCKTCHNNPVALGYGRGELKYNVSNGKGYWSFSPKYELRSNDNLPEDAWIGFLKTSKGSTTTRTNTRPFTAEEQKRILTIGACFACHNEKDGKVYNLLKDFNKNRHLLPKSCILPIY